MCHAHNLRSASSTISRDRKLTNQKTKIFVQTNPITDQTSSTILSTYYRDFKKTLKSNIEYWLNFMENMQTFWTNNFVYV